MDNFVSYSQHGDDFIAWQLLGKPKTGFVVEVGAFDGIHLSNSFSLENLGWSSLCIEPNPRIFEYLTSNRPKSLNINKAIVGSPSTKTIDFFSEDIGVLSGAKYDEEDVKRRYQNRGLQYNSPKKIVVQAVDMNTLLTESKIENVDLLSIDVEGFEMEVLKGLDFDRFSINLMIIEANSKIEENEIKEYISKQQHFVYLGNNYQNLFFIRRKSLIRNNLMQLDTTNFTKAVQRHPISEEYCIQAVEPRFEPSVEFKNHLKPWWRRI